MDFNEIKEWYLVPWQKFVDFEGRARRKEFWTFVLVNIVISVIISSISTTLGSLFSLAIFIPSLAVSVRRLHDIGKTGWWLLIGFIPLVGLIVLIYFYVQEGQSGSNEYGTNPKGTL